MYELQADKTRIKNIDFVPAGSTGLKFKDLKFLVMHYTAGRGFDSTVAHFKEPANKVSAHFVVGREGQVVQMATLTLPAWHAGADSELSWSKDGSLANTFHYRGMNFYSLGIEVDNYGPLTKVGSDFKTWFGRKVPPDQVAEVDPKAPGSFGRRWWHEYSEAQVQICEDLVVCLVRGLDLVDVVGHSTVCPVRKTDPGPVFPLKQIRALAFGREG